MKINFVLLLFLSPVVAQTSLDAQREYAADFYKQELYFQAVTEYKRLLYFDEDKKYTYEANFRIAESYKEGGFYDNAVFYYTKAAETADSTSARFGALIGTVRANLLRGTSYRALDILNEIRDKNEYAAYYDDILYWKGWAYMFADEWEKAAVMFRTISPSHPLRKLAEQTADDKYSVTFAKVISYILPGSGEVYTGNYLSGLISLSWNALFGYLTVNSFIEERVFDGVMVGSLLWLRFYRGGADEAAKSAEKRNREIYNMAMKYLQNNYEGIKP